MSPISPSLPKDVQLNDYKILLSGYRDGVKYLTGFLPEDCQPDCLLSSDNSSLSVYGFKIDTDELKNELNKHGFNRFYEICAESRGPSLFGMADRKLGNAVKSIRLSSFNHAIRHAFTFGGCDHLSKRVSVRACVADYEVGGFCRELEKLGFGVTKTDTRTYAKLAYHVPEYMG